MNTQPKSPHEPGSRYGFFIFHSSRSLVPGKQPEVSS